MIKRISLILIAVITIYFQWMYFINGKQEFSEIENRSMTAFPAFTLNKIIRGSFQEQLESALKDQIQYRYEMIELTSLIKSSTKKYVNYVYNVTPDFSHDSYKETKSAFNKEPSAAEPNLDSSTPESKAEDGIQQDKEEPSQSTPTNTPEASYTPENVDTPEPNSTPAKAPDYWLEPLGNVYKINGTDCLSLYPHLENTLYKTRAEIRVAQIKEILKRHPDVKVYGYYITKSEDLDWFDESEGIKAFDYASFVASKLPEEVRFGRMTYSGLDELLDLSFWTDHHWNHRGSYRGYQDIYEMISKDFDLSPLKMPVAELDFDGLEYVGSKGKRAGTSVVPDKFIVYDYDLGDYLSYIGDEQREIGLMQEYKEGKMNRDKNAEHYQRYYGTEEIQKVVKHVFPNNQYNLLYMGDSNNRAIRRLLASHFKTTIFVDYRIFAKTDIDQIIEENDIDAVLISAQHYLWIGQENFQAFINYPTKVSQGE